MLFSLRHQKSLRSGSLKPSFSRNLRRSLLRNLLDYCEPEYSDYGEEIAGYVEVNRAESAVLKETGKETLRYFISESSRWGRCRPHLSHHRTCRSAYGGSR